MKIIKYKNRKLYSPDLGGYINLTEIADLIKDGGTITATTLEGKSITNEVLKSALLKVNIDNDTILNLIRS